MTTRRSAQAVPDRTAASNIQELVTVGRVRERARVKFPEDAIAIARDEIVSSVANREGKEFPEVAQQVPSASEFVQDVGDRIGTSEDALRRLLEIDNYVEGVEHGRRGTVPFENARRKGTLERCEAEEITTIKVQDEADEAVAETTDTVVEEDRVGHRRHSTWALIVTHIIARDRGHKFFDHSYRRGSKTMDACFRPIAKCFLSRDLKLRQLTGL